MKKYRQLLIIFVTVFLSACASSHILITSNKYHFPLTHSKIMIVGVIKDDDDSIRVQMEKSITADLKGMGYNAVSAFEEFGPKGLANLGLQETYLKLCNQGIDAVIIFTLIDKTREDQFRTKRSFAYPDNYYFNRIWNYKNIQADLTNKDPNVKSGYFWEAILFNLGTLEAECTIQSSSFIPGKNRITDFDKKLVKKMVREKIVKKQTVETLKAF